LRLICDMKLLPEQFSNRNIRVLMPHNGQTRNFLCISDQKTHTLHRLTALAFNLLLVSSICAYPLYPLTSAAHETYIIQLL